MFHACSEWIDDGHQLIVGVDANEDVQTGDTLEFFRALGMKEVILERNRGLSPQQHTTETPSANPLTDCGLHGALKLGQEDTKRSA